MTHSNTDPVPAIALPAVTIHLGDALRLLPLLPSESIDAVVCDPPYAIRASTAMTTELSPGRQSETGRQTTHADAGMFADAAMLGQKSMNWHEKATHSRGYADNDNALFEQWVALWATECRRLLKPGGHLVAFGGTRTWHRLAIAIEDAGLVLEDPLTWLYATGCPKSLNVGRAVAEARRSRVDAHLAGDSQEDSEQVNPEASALTWDGWYTGVKPAHEPIVVATKLHRGVASIGDNADTPAWDGEWSSIDPSRRPAPSAAQADPRTPHPMTTHLTTRFLYVPKPSRAERVSVAGAAHPTVKPLSLMRELITMTTGPGALVLDPFVGSGTTIEAALLEGRASIGIERDPTYLPLINARVDRQTQSTLFTKATGL